MAMTFTYDDGHDGKGGRGRYRKVTATWTSNSSGAASGTTRKIVGRLVAGITIPSGSAAPTADYDITITDENSFNVLSTCDDDLIDRHTSNTEEVYFLVDDHGGTPTAVALHPVVCDALTITVANAGDTKSGTLILYVEM